MFRAHSTHHQEVNDAISVYSDDTRGCICTICVVDLMMGGMRSKHVEEFNPLNAELNPICYLLALLAHHFLHISRIRVKSLTLRLLMSYIYIEHLFLMFLDHAQRRSTVGRTPLDE